MKWDEALLHAMNDIRDELVEQSAAPSYPRRRLRWLPVAACFLLLLGAALLLWKYKPVEQEVPTPLSQEDTALRNVFQLPDGTAVTSPTAE